VSWVSEWWASYAAHSDKVNPIVAGLGGAGLVWAAIQQARTTTRRNYEQTRAEQQRRVTESFSKAVEQLAHEKIEARLGGIYTLERLAIEAIAQVRPLPWWRRLLLRLLRRNQPPSADPVSDLYWTVMETLTAFVRERARSQEPEASASGITAQPDLLQARAQSDPKPQPSEPKPSTDIAAVLAVIRRRPDAGREHETWRGWRFDFNTTDLRGAHFIGAHLEGAYLREAHLEGAILVAAHLKGARLTRAHLEGAYLTRAHLERAYLSEAHLEGTHLYRAHLEGAFLLGAYFEGADLRETHLEGAYLTEAHLEGVDLSLAFGDTKTRLPDGVARPADWPPYAP
jgi:Pentapeptide repeats (8 copies)